MARQTYQYDPDDHRRDLETSTKLASLETKVQKLEDEVIEIKTDVKQIRDTIVGVKGSWQVVLAIGGILSALIVTVTQGFLGKFF